MLKITHLKGKDLVSIETKKTTLAQVWAEKKIIVKPGRQHRSPDGGQDLGLDPLELAAEHADDHLPVDTSRTTWPSVAESLCV